ncbi:MAG: acyl carrier protein [Pseudobutyrivibrio sp.]|uniref:acyl carrier protein n=1 Tax=Pseudobutyrivibrio sp. TaxID=2014367 RepID=UPI0025E9F2B1|nr:acyl carrier protein [Pseudobutyrivibrio sp.]MBQ8488782.1 acyl carrier protein [Pseudobutyrivibrio sp.]
MAREIIFKDVEKIIRETLCLESDVEINESQGFKTELGCDSLDIMAIISEIEDFYATTIPEEEMSQLHTVGEVVDKIESIVA